MKGAEKRPYDSSFLIMGAGGLIIAIGIIALKGYYGVGDQSIFDLSEIITGTLSGVFMIVTGFLIMFWPQKHRVLGAIVLVLSILSFLGTSGGLFIGAIAGFLGGIMTISWRPKQVLNGDKAGNSN